MPGAWLLLRAAELHFKLHADIFATSVRGRPILAIGAHSKADLGERLVAADPSRSA